jgi:hypothetical protein
MYSPARSTAGIAATVISGCSGAAADVNAALPVPELHPATKTGATKTGATKTSATKTGAVRTGTASTLIPKSHRVKKLRVRIVVLPPNPSRDRDRAPQWHGLRNNRPLRWLMLGRFLLTGSD